MSILPRMIAVGGEFRREMDTARQRHEQQHAISAKLCIDCTISSISKSACQRTSAAYCRRLAADEARRIDLGAEASELGFEQARR